MKYIIKDGGIIVDK